jgi:hypothetical protein
MHILLISHRVLRHLHQQHLMLELLQQHLNISTRIHHLQTLFLDLQGLLSM